MEAGGSQVPATSNVGHWNVVVGGVRRCLIPETPVDSHGKLVLHSLRDVEPVQFTVKHFCRTTVVLAGAGDRAAAFSTRCSSSSVIVFGTEAGQN